MCDIGQHAIVKIDGRFYPVPLKNTFIHFDFADKKHMLTRRSQSLPVTQSGGLAKPCAPLDSSPLAEELPRSDHHPSKGSVLHDGQGSCRPCAWHWKPSGCSKGASCEFCHACDAGQLKQKKKQRINQLKDEKRLELMSREQILNLPEAKVTSRTGVIRATRVQTSRQKKPVRIPRMGQAQGEGSPPIYAKGLGNTSSSQKIIGNPLGKAQTP